MQQVKKMPQLFAAVQMQKIFADGKTFPDCILKSSAEEIERLYLQQKDKPHFDLQQFVTEHFTVPEAPQSHYHSTETDVKKHINNLWPVLTRSADAHINETYSSLIPLPNAYIVPGGRFGEIYYWDSYFTMLGLQVSGYTGMIENMINNFSFLIDHIGYIPNGNRTYFEGRSQPPFYACMIQLLAAEKGDDVFTKYLPYLQKEYDYWMSGAADINATCKASKHVVAPGDVLLNRYWDENDTPRPESFREDVELAEHCTDKKSLYRHIRAAAESGWDFSCRWFKHTDVFNSIHTTEIIPVDLNCLLYNLEKTLSKAYAVSNKEYALAYQGKAEKRKAAINTYCWSQERMFYFDYDIESGSRKELRTIATAFPLYFKIATEEMAAAVAAGIEKDFLKDGGVTTTLLHTGQQWDAPNGWAPLQWITIVGLKNYGYDDLAKTIALRWIALNKKVYQRTGKLMEKYNVHETELEAGGGEYPSQDGFGWTNGVLLKLMQMYEV